MKKFIKVIIIIIVMFCVYKVGMKGYQYYKDENTYKEISTLKPTETLENTEDSSNDNSLNSIDMEKYNELLMINSDYRMWLTIENTVIDYPVVQGEDNDFYLTHDFNKNESISGTLFIDYNNNIESDKNIIIYGHHMKNQSMFHNLNFFKEEEFFKENKIRIIEAGEEHIYEPFSVYVIHEDDAVFNISFSDDDSYKDYVQSLNSKSYFNKDIDLEKDSEIVTLVTCSYEYDGARTVVHGIRYR